MTPDTPTDPYGLTAGVPSGTSPGVPAPTGPNEVWWAPYDPWQVPNGVPGGTFKAGLLFPMIGMSNVWKCPIEPEWQCSYGMNYATGSPMAANDVEVTSQSERIDGFGIQILKHVFVPSAEFLRIQGTSEGDGRTSRTH